MATNTAVTQSSQPVSITDVIGQYVALRRTGRELLGLCPFHAENTPSFSVNEEKGVYYCFACGSGGDSITFIQKIEGVDFKTAARRLGRENYRPSPQQIQIRTEAKLISSWARTTSRRICDALREIGDELHISRLARQKLEATSDLVQHEATLVRRWAILCDLDDDLNDLKLALDLWEQRDDIKRLVDSL